MHVNPHSLSFNHSRQRGITSLLKDCSLIHPRVDRNGHNGAFMPLCDIVGLNEADCQPIVVAPLNCILIRVIKAYVWPGIEAAEI